MPDTTNAASSNDAGFEALSDLVAVASEAASIEHMSCGGWMDDEHETRVLRERYLKGEWEEIIERCPDELAAAMQAPEAQQQIATLKSFARGRLPMLGKVISERLASIPEASNLRDVMASHGLSGKTGKGIGL